MVLFNYATKELTAKVVYYGPGLCGKTSNLQHIYDTLPDGSKGKMLSLATKTDRTLFFDFLPIDLGNIRGMKTKIQLYTVPGQVFYDTTRKLVLKGADGVVFVADSQEPMLEANIDSFENLITNLKEQNQTLSEIPHVIQYNKRDMKNAMDIAEMEPRINRYKMPYFGAVAITGEGVFETLKGISKLVLKHLTQKYGLEVEKDKLRKAASRPSLPPLEQKPKPKPVPDLPSTDSLQKEKSVPAAKVKPEPKPQPVKDPMEQIEFDEKPVADASSQPRRSVINSLPSEFSPERVESLPELDDSELIELDDIAPLEIEELDEMAEIANLASESDQNGPPAPTKMEAAPVDPISVPVAITLPTTFVGKPIQLVIDISFEDK